MILSSMAKRILSVGICCLIGLGFWTGCSNDEDDSNNGNEPVIVTVTLGGTSMDVNLRDLPSQEFEGLDGIILNEIISQNLVEPWLDPDSVAWDMRPLHAYRTVGSDGYSPHSHANHYQDLWWDWMSLGYILVESRDVIFPDAWIDLPGAYNVDDTEEILVFRILKVVTPIDSFLVEFDDITQTQVLNPDTVLEAALPLADFVPDTIMALGPENYQYKIVGIDDFTQNTPLTWEQLQVGYWLLQTEQTWFLSDTLHTGHYKIKAAERLEIF